MNTQKTTSKRYRRGEGHPRASLTDRELALALELVEVYRMPISEVAEKFEVNKATIYRWLHGERRTARAD
jgi:transposase